MRGRRGANACGGEGRHVSGRGANACGREGRHVRGRGGGGQMLVAERVDT